MSASKVYDKLVEKATSPLLLETDWESVLRMCDLIRQGDVQAKYAVTGIKKKLTQENMNTLLFSLQCLESMVKNCGSKIHQEIATKDTMEQLRGIALVKSDPIKTKVLELIQCWAHAFKRNPNYKIVEDYFNSMKLEGFQYPALKEAEAMFDVEEAPAWKEDNEATCCFRCRSEFTTLKRRHHCRACGQIFCNACSSKTAPIPKFGIEKEVRVCDLCYEKLSGSVSLPAGVAANSISGVGANGSESELPAEYVNSPLFKESIAASVKKPAVKSEQEFEDELQLALAISQSEAEAQDSMKRRSSQSSQSTSNNQSKNSNENTKKSSLKSSSLPKSLSTHSNNDNDKNASAPYSETTTPKQQTTTSSQILLSSQSDEEIKINTEIDQFVSSTKSTLEIFINRMKSDQQRGRSITNDTAVQSLFLQLQHMHPKLMSYVKYQEDAREYYENLQDKLTQLKDAREALNALRQESGERKRRELEEREMQRQGQIAQKLQYMRQQKQNYYQYQNQLNLQHLAEKERELQMRMEQQRQLVIQRDQQFMGTSQPQPQYQTYALAGGMPPNYQQYMNESTAPSYQQQYQGGGQVVSPSKQLGNMSLQQTDSANMTQQFHTQQQQQQHVQYQQGPNQFSSQQYPNQYQLPQQQNVQTTTTNPNQSYYQQAAVAPNELNQNQQPDQSQPPQIRPVVNEAQLISFD